METLLHTLEKPIESQARVVGVAKESATNVCSPLADCPEQVGKQDG